ncbi:hypothetical protein Pan97_02410 [Bremerella volcania]|uniref:Uncharacterized protein n=1 Tax=Bremerella volcania TaxID=2527984 RepID=A0A518C269_9BACT|nr:hypothetical protein Pan97_02410 [Bremerella volcania]
MLGKNGPFPGDIQVSAQEAWQLIPFAYVTDYDGWRSLSPPCPSEMSWQPTHMGKYHASLPA